MSTTADPKPCIVWVDDNVFESGIFLALPFYLDGTFDLAVFADTDSAIAYTLQNSSRIFMFIQDSRRPEGSIIPAWKRLRQRPSPHVGWNGHSGDFYTFVIDAFAPTASCLFCGIFDQGDTSLIRNWAGRDKRIHLVDKTTNLEYNTLINIATQQFDRWKSAGSDLTPDLAALSPLTEELAVVCGARADYLDALTPRQFEELIASLFRNHGFRVELTAQTRDGGYDIAAVSSSSLPEEVALIEVKHFAPHRPVSVGIVRALYGVKMLRQAGKAVLVTSSHVSADAKREFSRVIPWELEFAERGKVLQWCEQYLEGLLKQSPGG